MKIDLRRKGHKELVMRLGKIMRDEQFRKVAEYFHREWQRDQDLKDIELLSLYEDQSERLS